MPYLGEGFVSSFDRKHRAIDDGLVALLRETQTGHLRKEID